MRALAWTAAASLLLAFAPVSAAAEVSVGLTGGVVFAGEQDIKLAEYGADRQRVSLTERRGADASPGPLGGLTITAWETRWPWLGVQLDALRWTTSATVDPGGTAGAATLTIDQTRTAVFASVLGRLVLDEARGAFAYGGLGGGLVRSRVTRGDEEIGAGFGLVGGVAVPLTPRLRLRVEVRYLVTPDVDASPRAGLRVDTSGSADGNAAHVVFGPHLDTQFFPLLVGLDWVF